MRAFLLPYGLSCLLLACGDDAVPGGDRADGSPADDASAGSGAAGDAAADAQSRECEPRMTESCYSGSSGTEGVGACRAGERTCSRDGSGWSACEGEVTEADESCLTPADDDCDGQTNEEGAGCACVPGTMSPCYSGPASTMDVAPCASGMQTCNEDGTGYEPGCAGETLPIAEICANSVDDDCDGTADNVDDEDGDGYTRCEGDCCETTADCAAPAFVNPAAAEAPTPSGETALDEDCDAVTDEAESCDSGLLLADADPLNAARAIDACRSVTQDEPEWGVVSARYVRANGTDASASLQVGIMDAFGANVVPQAGSRLLVLSSGRARTLAQSGACGNPSCTNNTGVAPPAGFPQAVPSCPVGISINDDFGLELQLKAPSNAVGFSFDFRFYTFDYPELACTSYSDQFVAIVNPAPLGSINGNVAFDAFTAPVGVNIEYLDVCQGCTLGTTDLAGTGFDTWNDAGATGWLRASAPVSAGAEFSLRLLIWDTGDQSFDSTVLIDNFQWIAGPGSVVVGTAQE